MLKRAAWLHVVKAEPGTAAVNGWRSPAVRFSLIDVRVRACVSCGCAARWAHVGVWYFFFQKDIYIDWSKVVIVMLDIFLSINQILKPLLHNLKCGVM